MAGFPQLRFEGEATVRSVAAPSCDLCQSSGEVLYQDLSDRIFSAPGHWNIRACTNRQCGLRWLDPRPFESELAKFYKQYFTHTEPERNSVVRRAFRYFLDAYLSWLTSYPGSRRSICAELSSYLLELYPPKRSDFDFPMRYLRGRVKGRLLDLGCGGGLTLEAAQRAGWEAEGIDPDSEAVANVRRKGLRARTGLLPELRLPGASYDVIVMNHVIEHLHDPLEVLMECRRILRKGGLVLINTPNTESLGHRRFGKNWFALDPPRHLYLFAARSLRRMVEAAGFAVVSLETATGRAAGVLTASRAIARTGRFDMRQAPSSYGRIVEMFEWAANFWRLAGEEVRLAGEAPRG